VADAQHKGFGFCVLWERGIRIANSSHARSGWLQSLVSTKVG
jgi:hypothetical protein